MINIRQATNMKKIFVFTLVLFLIGCKKKERQAESIYEEVNRITELKNYTISKEKVNDSIFEIRGINNQFNIVGYLDEKNNKKVGWYLVNKNNITKDTVLNAEYLPLGNKEFINQYILYENNKINLKISKFYKNYNRNNNYKVHFNLPADMNFITNSYTFKYFVMLNNNVVVSEKISGTSSPSNKFDFNINLSKYPNFNFIKGVFSCYASRNLGKDSIQVVNTQIYTEFYR